MATLAKSISAANSSVAAIAPNGNAPAKEAAKKARGGNVKPGTAKVATTKIKPETWQTRGNSDLKAVKLFDSKDFHAMNNAEADKAITQIKRSGLALKTMAHKAACGILLHYVQHGDYTKIEALATAVMVGMSRKMANGLVAWVKAFSSLKYDDEKMSFFHPKGASRFFHLTGDNNAPDGSYHREGALNQPFYSASFGDKPEPHQFDAEKYIAETLQRMVAKLEAEFAKKNAENTPAKLAKRIKVDRDHIKALEGVAKTLHVKLTPATQTANRQAV